MTGGKHSRETFSPKLQFDMVSELNQTQFAFSLPIFSLVIIFTVMGDDKSKSTPPIVDINNLQSPHYLSSANYPRNIISPIILNRDNYTNWNRIVSNALKSKNKFGFVFD